jgi:hypothetical protein
MTIGRALAFVDHTHVTPEGDIQCPKCNIEVLADDLLES